ncbi:DNA-binding transcriptional LysR family regulator [Rhodopseudomonas rhenobacensis]|uniref:DNA-binding transcriptional LysR family regulator n=1 Tax=Rhodopseudomonas rhenobacensis TaxID=87461 RepID=A0A7W8E0Y7_9BRAD|nr:LysR family transcriptional regulator [Rhodopseudomonas rhenobacensis]MBB5049954.1 DNA-binding transcriptional LysR family regulator [Rhodopseudomonas rhenobacensis]
MLHSRLLRYLDEVVSSGSIRQAAERLNVASSSINRQILELESKIQVPIFERLPRGLRLTAAGEILITHIRQTLRDHDRVQSRISELRGLNRGTIKVATMSGLASGVLSRLVVRFREEYPGIKIVVHTYLADAILNAVEQADVDFGFGYNLRADPSLHLLHVFAARLGAIVSAQHPLAKLPGVRLADCCNYPVVLADSTTSIYRQVHNACVGSKVTLKPTFETNSVELMKYLAIRDSAVTFLSATDVSEEIRDGDLVFLRILDQSLKSHPLAMIHRANTSLALSPALFAEMLRIETLKLLERGHLAQQDMA